MARYGSFKYGAAKYGTDTSINVTTWAFLVDWAGTMWAASDNEAPGRMIGLSMSRGRDNYLKPNGGGLERYRPGELTAIFDNSDGRFDPYNTSSPLYPNVLPGKLVDVRARDKTLGGAGAYRSVMRGKIADIQNFRRGGRELTAIKVVDGLGFLRDQIITLGLAGGGVGTRINNVILPATGWPDILYRAWPIWTPAPTSKIINQYAAYNFNALDTIHDLEDVELGQFVHTRDGYGRIYPSSYTYSETITITEEECLTDISLPSPWENIRNDININVYPRRYVTVNDVIFRLDRPVEITAFGSVEFEAKFVWDNKPTIGQFLTYDLVMNTAADGSGAGLGGGITTPLIEPGFSTRLRVFNGSGVDGWITKCDVIAQNVSYVRSESTAIAADAASQAIYGRRSLLIDSPWQWDVTYAQAAANWLLDKLKTPTQWPTIHLEDRFDLQFNPDIYNTRIRLVAPSKNIDGYFRAGKIEHQWLGENGNSVRTTFKLEPYFTPFT